MDHPPEPTSGAVVWSRVDAYFHVASRAGDFLGYVDRHLDGGFGAYDQYSHEIGLFPDLSSATAAVEVRHDQNPTSRGPA
jgi:hypothetical protein